MNHYSYYYLFKGAYLTTLRQASFLKWAKI